jgi:hypothetical protein
MCFMYSTDETLYARSRSRIISHYTVTLLRYRNGNIDGVPNKTFSPYSLDKTETYSKNTGGHLCFINLFNDKNSKLVTHSNQPLVCNFFYKIRQPRIQQQLLPAPASSSTRTTSNFPWHAAIHRVVVLSQRTHTADNSCCPRILGNCGMVSAAQPLSTDKGIFFERRA